MRKNKSKSKMLPIMLIGIPVLVAALCTVILGLVWRGQHAKIRNTLSRVENVSAQVNQDDYAYPRGKNPAYGWMGCGYFFPNGFSIPERCAQDDYTVFMDMYGNLNADSIGKEVANLNSQGAKHKRFMPYLGWGPYRKDLGFTDVPAFLVEDAAKAQAWWDNRLAKIKDEVSKSVNPNELLGFYTTDEPIVVDELKYQYNAIKKYFPNALVFAYGTTYGGPWSVFKDTRLYYNDPSKLITTFGANGYKSMPYADVVGISKYFTYSKIRTGEKISHGALYYKVQALIDGICTQYSYCRGQQNDQYSWKKQGKTVYTVPEAYADACIVSSSDPDRSSLSRVYDKLINEIVQGVAGGSQGMFAYEHGRISRGEVSIECNEAIRNFYPVYQEMWPWIMAGNFERKSVAITSGMTTWNIPSDSDWEFVPNHPTLVATQFDYSGKKMLVVVNLMAPTDYSGNISGTVSGLLNGTYDQLSTNQSTDSVVRNSVSISNNQVSVTLPAYGYAIFVQKSGNGGVIPSSSPSQSIRPSSSPSESPIILPSPSITNTVVVRARGTAASNGRSLEYPRMSVIIDGKKVYEQFVTENYSNYSVSTSESVKSVEVHYLNDLESDPNNDRNMQVDAINVNGTVYQSESPSTYSEGTWTASNQCEGGNKQSEWLHCNGFLRFTLNGSVPPAPPSPSPITQETIQAESFSATGGTVVVSSQETKPGVLIRDGYIHRFDPDDYVTYNLRNSLSTYSQLTIYIKPRNTGGRIDILGGSSTAPIIATLDGFSSPAGLTLPDWQRNQLSINTVGISTKQITLRAKDTYEIGYIDRILLTK